MKRFSVTQAVPPLRHLRTEIHISVVPSQWRMLLARRMRRFARVPRLPTESAWAEQSAFVQYATAQILAEALTIEGAIPQLLQTLCTALGWSIGEVWYMRSSTNTLECFQSWYRPGVEVAHEIEQRPAPYLALDEGLIKRAWHTRRPQWFSDTLHERHDGDAALTQHTLRSACAVPILLDDDVIAVAAFLSETVRPRDDDMLNLVTVISAQVGQFIRRKRVEAALQRERDFTAAVIETAPSLVIVLDRQGKIVRFNRACEQTTGYIFADVCGQPVWNLLAPEEVGAVQSAFIDLQSELSPATFEHWWLTRAGRRRRIRWSTTALLDGDGSPEYIIGTGIDITERQQAELELQRQNDYFAALYSTCLALMNRLDLNDLLETIVRWAADLLGTPHGSVLLVDPVEDRLILRVGVGLYSEFIGLREQRGVGLSGTVWATGAALIVNSYDVWEQRSPYFKHLPLRAVVGVPLISAGQVAGILGMAHTESGREFTTQEVQLLEGFAQIAAVALDNARLYTSAQQEIAERRQAETALRESEARFRAAADGSFDAFFVFKSIRTETGGIEDFEFIDLNAQAERLLRLPRSAVLGQRLCVLLPINRTHGFFERYVRVVETRQAIQEEFAIDTPEIAATWLHHQVIPLADGLAITSRDITERKRIEAQIQAANMQLAASLAELEQHTSELLLLSELSNLLQACRTIDAAYDAIGQCLPRLFPEEAGLFAVINRAQTEVEAVVRWGDPASPHTFPVNACWALQHGHAYHIESDHAAPACSHLQLPVPGSYVCRPISVDPTLLALLHIHQPMPPGLGAAKLRLIETVAGAIDMTLANLKLQETLRNQSIRDPLTGLFNRRYLEESLEREVSRAARANRPISVIMLDVDHFKQFNDSFGHDAGDALLREIGALISTQTRGSDIGCRYGGEEFAIIMPEAASETAFQRADELRQAVKRLEVIHLRQSLGPVTISLGVASFPLHAEDGAAIMRGADRALYRAKRAGRDCVCLG